MISPEFDHSFVRDRISADLKARIKAKGSTRAAFHDLQKAAAKTGFINKADYVKILMGMELAHDRSDHAQFFHGVQRNFGKVEDPGISYGSFLKYVAAKDKAKVQKVFAEPETKHIASARHDVAVDSKAAETATSRTNRRRRLADQVLPRGELIRELSARMWKISSDPTVVLQYVTKAIAKASSPTAVLRSWRH